MCVTVQWKNGFGAMVVRSCYYPQVLAWVRALHPEFVSAGHFRVLLEPFLPNPQTVFTAMVHWIGAVPRPALEVLHKPHSFRTELGQDAKAEIAPFFGHCNHKLVAGRDYLVLVV